MTVTMAEAATALHAAGLPDQAAHEWSRTLPSKTGDYGSDSRTFAEIWRRSAALLRSLPPKPLRNEGEQSAADALLSAARASREAFLCVHVD
jgi:hypothetical protein